MTQEQIEVKVLESRDTFIDQVLAMLDFIGLERSKLNKIQTFMEDNFPGLATASAVGGLQWVKASTWPSNGTDKHWRHPSGKVIGWQNAFDQLAAETPLFTPEYLSESSPAQPGYSEAIQIVKDIAGIVNTFEVGEIMSRAEQLLGTLNKHP